MVAPVLNSYGSSPRGRGAPPPGASDSGLDDGEIPDHGVNLDDLNYDNMLTAEQIDAVKRALGAELDIGIAGVGLQGQGLAFQRDVGMREIAQAQLQGLEGAERNALQRGIFNSGIRVKNQQEVIEQAGVAKADLERGITLGLQQLQLQVAQLTNQFAMNLGQTGMGLLAGQDALNAGMIGSNNVYGGGSGGSGSRADNTNPANIAAARSGEGPYGARVQLVQSYASQWRDMFPGIAIQGDGYFRPAGESTRKDGRSPNSDHITGGALDIFVRTPEERAAFNAWYAAVWPQLQQQGMVASYVSVGANAAHNDHMHISFSLTGPGASSANTDTAVATAPTGGGRYGRN
jgi:hypothetical protein